MLSIGNILEKFETVSLAEIENSAMLKRSEVKFLLKEPELLSFLEQMASAYKVLSIHQSLRFAYQTQYMDTARFDMYLAHHNGKLNRFKIRQRTYMQTNKTYLEVKFSSNTDRISKFRILQDASARHTEDVEKFVAEKSPYRFSALSPSVKVCYNRVTLVNKQNGERVTIDTDLEFSNGVSRHKFSKFVVLEIKQTQKLKSPALALLEEMRVKPRSLSKYCLGINYLYPGVKKNRMKKKLSELEKQVVPG